jgi:hypothetical protein
MPSAENGRGWFVLIIVFDLARKKSGVFIKSPFKTLSFMALNQLNLNGRW